MPTTVIDLDDLDLFVSGDPYAAWTWLRENAPVYWNATSGGGGYWALTRYEDVVEVYRDPSSYSSRNGTVLGGSYRSATDTASGQMLICSDPPEHRLLRQHVHKAFGAPMMERAGGFVRRYLGAALDRLVADGGGDFAVDIAPLLPAGLLAAMFGIGRDDAMRLLGLTRTMIGYRDGEYVGANTSSMALVAAQVEIFDLLADLLDRRRQEPGDDLVSMLVAARTNGRALNESQILYNALNVAVGGNETTPFTASAIVETLIGDPGQESRLHADPGLLGTAVDELFRWTSTNAYVCRTTTRDVTIRGVPIPAGETLTLWNASANRDAEAFPHADRLDLGRTPNHHVAFGVANHRCVGMSAARLEITLLMEELLARGLRFRLAGPVERLASNFMLGIKHLPVELA
ncbi:cytochrome P450 [Micromonospora sp. KLBMP9576]|uniref:cytochrome P450 n=1 Tax=Micromonospora sp. KLBMP9576 TaxID=3424769 RepID=UPI003D91F760